MTLSMWWSTRGMLSLSADSRSVLHDEWRMWRRMRGKYARAFNASSGIHDLTETRRLHLTALADVLFGLDVNDRLTTDPTNSPLDAYYSGLQQAALQLHHSAERFRTELLEAVHQERPLDTAIGAWDDLRAVIDRATTSARNHGHVFTLGDGHIG